jgi:hypothetical protein
MRFKTRFFNFAVCLSLAISLPAFAQVKAKITVTQAKLDSVCGTHAVKLVFMCQNLAWVVDFSQPTPQVQAMSGVASAYYPVISSDGRWVTYQTGIEAEGPTSSTTVGKSWLRECAATGTAVKVADTGYVPRFVQNTSADTPEILYSTSVACPQSLCYTGGQTVKRKIIGKVPQASEVVFAQGSYYGGLSWDNRYLGTGWEGGPNGFILDLLGPAATPRPVHTMRTMKVKKDSTALDTFNMIPIGTCNISRSASRIFTNTLLYFDFSSALIRNAGYFHPLLGNWKMHEKLFISRYDGEDLQVYDMPIDRPVISIASAQGTGEAVGKMWDNPEWSNHPYFAVASLSIDRLFKVSAGWQHNNNHESIYLLNLKDSTYVKLIEATDTAITTQTNFVYPFVWVEVPAAFKEDSTWLAKTIWEKAGISVAGKYTIGVKRNPIAPGNVHAAPTLWSNAKATRIVVYSVLGQEITALEKTGNKEIDPAKFLHRLHSGIYFIGIESPGQKRQVVRWVNTRQK